MWLICAHEWNVKCSGVVQAARARITLAFTWKENNPSREVSREQRPVNFDMIVVIGLSISISGDSRVNLHVYICEQDAELAYDYANN